MIDRQSDVVSILAYYLTALAQNPLVRFVVVLLYNLYKKFTTNRMIGVWVLKHASYTLCLKNRHWRCAL